MSDNSTYFFSKLKEKVVQRFLEEQKSVSNNASEWGMNEIKLFQDHLFERTNSSVSEKWFYTYFKNSSEKLPRVDMLNILSVYAGYQNWSDFKSQNNQPEEKRIKNSYIYILPFAIIVLLGFGLTWFMGKEHEFKFCFVDNYTNQNIKTKLEVIVLRKRESPHYLKPNEESCYSWKTTDEEIKLVIKSPYHHTDTIYRSIHSKGQEKIKLRTDDYALMIHYYSTKNVKDWKKRRNQLNEIIHSDAIIYQVYEGNIGVELYTKNDFVNRLTLPTSNLKNIEIIETEYKQGKIAALKFKLKQSND